jgi:hypothetical protein
VQRLIQAIRPCGGSCSASSWCCASSSFWPLPWALYFSSAISSNGEAATSRWPIRICSATSSKPRGTAKLTISRIVDESRMVRRCTLERKNDTRSCVTRAQLFVVPLRTYHRNRLPIFIVILLCCLISMRRIGCVGGVLLRSSAHCCASLSLALSLSLGLSLSV